MNDAVLMPDQDEYLEIATPENIAFGYPLAGIGSRFIAALIDTAILLLLQGAVLLFSSLAVGISEEILQDLTGIILAAAGLVSFAFLWGYYIFFELIWNGQSPGKRITHLRVIRIDGAPIALPESAIRNLIRFIDFLPLFYGIGVVTMFIDSRARRLGDLAAGTLVVREKGVPVRLSDLESSMQKPSPEKPRLEGFGELPVEKLAESDLALVRDFLKRRAEMTNSQAVEHQILKRLFEQMGLPSPSLAENGRVDLLQRILAARRE